MKKSTGKVVAIRDDDFEMVRNMEEFDKIEEGDDGEIISDLDEYPDLETEFFQDVKNVLLLDDDYLKLPSKFDIDEYEIIKGFAFLFQMKKSVTYFWLKFVAWGVCGLKIRFISMGLKKIGSSLRDEAYKEIAVSWLENKGFAYADDMNRREKHLRPFVAGELKVAARFKVNCFGASLSARLCAFLIAFW